MLLIFNRSAFAGPDDLFSPSEWFGFYNGANSTFGCTNQDGILSCNMPSSEQVEELKSSFINVAPYTLSLLREIKEKSFDATREILNLEAQMAQEQVGDNSYSKFLTEIANETDSLFHRYFLAEGIPDLKAAADFFSNQSPYLEELDKMLFHAMSGLDDEELDTYLHTDSRKKFPMTMIVDEINISTSLGLKGGFYSRESLSSIYANNSSRDVFFSLPNREESIDFSKYLIIKDCEKLSMARNSYPAFYFRVGGDVDKPSLGAIDSERLKITSKADRDIIKELLNKEQKWTLQCEKVSKSKFEKSDIFKVDKSKKLMTLLFYTKKCNWFSCEGNTTNYWLKVINRNAFLEELRNSLL